MEQSTIKIQEAKNIETFKGELKTYLFQTHVIDKLLNLLFILYIYCNYFISFIFYCSNNIYVL